MLPKPFGVLTHGSYCGTVYNQTTVMLPKPFGVLTHGSYCGTVYNQTAVMLPKPFGVLTHGSYCGSVYNQTAELCYRHLSVCWHVVLIVEHCTTKRLSYVTDIFRCAGTWLLLWNSVQPNG
jgi:hypothetical protein